MSYVNIEWDYNEVQSIISGLDRASTTLKNVSTPSTANTGSAHHATLIKHLTALDTTISQMAWITNGTHRTPVRPSIGQMPAATSSSSPR